MKSPTFTSSLAGAMNDFVALKQAEGYKYESSANLLRDFDRFLVEHQFNGSVLSKEVLMSYQTKLLASSSNGRHKKMVVTRDFTCHYQLIEPQSAAIVINPFKRPKSPRPYIYSPDDLANLIRAASALEPAYTFTTLILLLYITGMRISEALSLTVKDFHQQPNRLFICDTKFGKDRWLVLRDSTASAIRSYLEIRRHFAPEQPDAPFFLNQKGTALSYSTASTTYRALLEKCDIGSNWQGSSPRLHGFRHTFAVNSLLNCYRQSIDPYLQLPKLATYLGHQNLAATKVYLHTTPELMELTSQRFHDYFYSMSSTAEVNDD